MSRDRAGGDKSLSGVRVRTVSVGLCRSMVQVLNARSSAREPFRSIIADWPLSTRSAASAGTTTVVRWQDGLRSRPSGPLNHEAE
jgi:hypothetical protein